MTARVTGCEPVLAVPTAEDMLTSEDYFGLTQASDMQRAACRVADGLPLGELRERLSVPMRGYEPDVAERTTIQWAIGGVRGDDATPEDRAKAEAAIDALPSTPPRIMQLLAGVRCGKSLWVAAMAVTRTQTIDVSPAATNERPRVSVVSLDKDKASEVRQHVDNALERSPRLRSMLIGEPTVEKRVFRHPTGRAVELVIVAGKRAGAATISKWSASAVFDEAARMVGAEDGIVNLTEQEKAVFARLLPGAQVFETSSPWGAYGPVYDRCDEFHGKPSAEQVVMRCCAPAMNSSWWTPERVEEIRRVDADTFAADVLGEFIAVLLSMFSSGELERILRGPSVEPPSGAIADTMEGRHYFDLPRDECMFYVAVMDPATRSNAWTLVIGAMYRDGVRRIACAREWVPTQGEPLVPKAVLTDIARCCQVYGVDTVNTDQWSADALANLGLEVGILLRPATASSRGNVNDFDSLRTLARSNPPLIQVPDVIHLRNDLQRAQRRVRGASITVKLPVTKDGRHCDYAPIVARFGGMFLPHPKPEPPPPRPGWSQQELDDEAAALATYEAKEDQGEVRGFFDE